MKKVLLYPLITALISSFSGGLFSQPDSLVTRKNSFPLFYFTFGPGANARGLNFKTEFSIASHNGLGGSINLTSGYMNLQNVPSDYYDGFLRFVTPSDNFNNLSLLFLKKFSSPSETFRLGLAAGPSWIKYDLISLELNPDYPDLFEYKYNKRHTIEYAAGFHASMIYEAVFSNFFSMDAALFADFNSIRNILGIDFCINAGFVRKK